MDEVIGKSKSANKLLAALHDGSDCLTKGQDAVNAATTQKDNAEKAATEVASAASAAADASVDLGSYSYNSLAKGTCTQLWSDPSHTAAQEAAS